MWRWPWKRVQGVELFVWSVGGITPNVVVVEAAASMGSPSGPDPSGEGAGIPRQSALGG